jgi:hypothetical protein
MATPHACWVILVGNVPTSFRAKVREDLVPTFKQLLRTQPDVALRWFERGKVWESPEAARAVVLLARTAAKERRPRRDPSLGPARDKDWRPGGAHKDPKARYEMTRDQKRAKFKRDQRSDDRPAAAPSAEAGKKPAPKRPPGDPFAK